MITLTDDQAKALQEILAWLVNTTHKYMILQGSAGTGKSTLVNQVIKNIQAQEKLLGVLKGGVTRKRHIFVTATTNPAAAVLSDMLGNLNVTTIHSLLGLVPYYDTKTGGQVLKLRGRAEEIEEAIIIVDEFSMANYKLAEWIEARTPKCKILIIGDRFQLAPIGQFTTCMENYSCPETALDKIIRNSDEIAIAGKQYRESVKTGIFKPLPVNDTSIKRVGGVEFKAIVDNLFTGSSTTEKSKIITYTNVAAQKYNGYIRKLKNLPEDIQARELVFTNKTIISAKKQSRGKGFHRPTDSPVRVLEVTEYLKEPLCGIEGRMITVGYKNSTHTAFMPKDIAEAKRLQKTLAARKDWSTLRIVKEDWLDLRSQYAGTIHKAQGRTYDTVLLDLGDIGKCHEPSTVARLMYVGITRARKQVVLYGNLPSHYLGG